MTDFQEPNPIRTSSNEGPPPRRYVHLVEAGDTEEREERRDRTVISFPKKRAGTIGMASLRLERHKDAPPQNLKNDSVLCITKDGATSKRRGDAYNEGFFTLDIDLSNPVAHFSENSEFMTYISLDEQTSLAVGSMVDWSSVQGENSDSYMGVVDWTLADPNDNNVEYYRDVPHHGELLVPYDRELLEQLSLSFAVSQKASGGEAR